MPFYNVRCYPDRVRSCGGPYATRAEAIRMAARLTPANSRGIAVVGERQDPVAEPGRPLLVRAAPRQDQPRRICDPECHVVAGPFATLAEVSAFLDEAFAPICRPISGAGLEPPLGSLLDDWEPVEVSDARGGERLPAGGGAQHLLGA
jgi:hypothetical protein